MKSLKFVRICVFFISFKKIFPQAFLVNYVSVLDYEWKLKNSTFFIRTLVLVYNGLKQRSTGLEPKIWPSNLDPLASKSDIEKSDFVKYCKMQKYCPFLFILRILPLRPYTVVDRVAKIIFIYNIFTQLEEVITNKSQVQYKSTWWNALLLWGLTKCFIKKKQISNYEETGD